MLAWRTPSDALRVFIKLAFPACSLSQPSHSDLSSQNLYMLLRESVPLYTFLGDSKVLTSFGATKLFQFLCVIEEETRLSMVSS